jgi:osmotically-inducible protein OsmY
MELNSSSEVVVGAARSDEAILDDVKLALLREVMFGTTVTVVGGAVMLGGKVDSWSQRRGAGLAAVGVDGVRRVVNLLVVKEPDLALASLRISMEDALSRRAIREARRLDLEIHDGRVTVTGTVGSVGERGAIIGALVGSRGVRGVNAELEIGPSSDLRR